MAEVEPGSVVFPFESISTDLAHALSVAVLGPQPIALSKQHADVS